MSQLNYLFSSNTVLVNLYQFRPLVKGTCTYQKIIFLIFSTKTHVVDTQKNRLNEPVLYSTKNICLILWVRKNLQFCAEKFCLSKPMPIFQSCWDGSSTKQRIKSSPLSQVHNQVTLSELSFLQ